MHKCIRVIPYDEIKRNGCQWCLDNKKVGSINIRKFYDEKELKKLNKKLKREDGKRYMFCPYKSCPYNKEFEGYDDYETWFEENEIIFSLDGLLDGQSFPKRVTFSSVHLYTNYIDTF